MSGCFTLYTSIKIPSKSLIYEAVPFVKISTSIHPTPNFDNQLIITKQGPTMRKFPGPDYSGHFNSIFA